MVRANNNPAGRRKYFSSQRVASLAHSHLAENHLAREKLLSDGTAAAAAGCDGGIRQWQARAGDVRHLVLQFRPEPAFARRVDAIRALVTEEVFGLVPFFLFNCHVFFFRFALHVQQRGFNKNNSSMMMDPILPILPTIGMTILALCSSSYARADGKQTKK